MISVNALFLILGALSLIFGVWTLFGLLFSRRKHRRVSRKWILGVCADFSAWVGIPLWLVRLYALLYAPLILGLLFYLLYYWAMKRRPPPPPVAARPPPEVTKMKSVYY
ncbi:MAG: PspC domain-containing protein [SAR324 cluster bacterium]|nr:PspC domain-containing protein [SAR324 cluster bacterium]